jgi:electron transfer flavoprotein beta subunit
VGIRGIRKVASKEIPVYGAGDLNLDAAITSGAVNLERSDYFVPAAGEGAEILEGSTEEITATLIDMLKSKGGIK